MENITSIRGIRCWGISAGLKASAKLDLTVMASDIPATAAAVFTKNKVLAEPLKLNKLHIKNGKAQAIVANSGNANACTGKHGYQGAIAMAETTAALLKIKKEDVLVLSTGIIGREFPTEKVLQGIKKCVPLMTNTYEAGKLAAEAILTTDTVTKEFSTHFDIDGVNVGIAGIAKGSGMIHPDMGTMLACIFSDVAIDRRMLNKAFREAVDYSFNMISVDGDTSTNDMAMVLCNGMAKNKIIRHKGKNYNLFSKKLREVCSALARMIVKDGEGVNKFIEYKVINAPSEEAAKKILRTISTSLLVKTAFFGKDPNWGRIIAAAGRAGTDFDIEKADLYIGGHALLLKGQPQIQNIEKAHEQLQFKEIFVTLNMNNGEAEATGWGSDLSTDYVIFNSAYTT